MLSVFGQRCLFLGYKINVVSCLLKIYNVFRSKKAVVRRHTVKHFEKIK